MSSKTLNWKIIRILFVATGIIYGFNLHTQKSDFPLPWIFSIGLLIITPLLVLAVIAMNSSRLPKFWNLPQWNINPLSLNEPFQLIHVVSWQTIVAGVVGCLLLPWTGLSYIGEATFPIAFGIGALFGIYLCSRVFHRRLRDKNFSVKTVFFGSWQDIKSTK